MEQICTDLSCPNRLKPFNISPWNGNDVLKWPLSLSLWVVWCDNYALLDGPKAPPERWKNEISKPCSCRHIRVILQIHQWSRLKNSPCLRLDYFTHTLHTHTHTLSLPLLPLPQQRRFFEIRLLVIELLSQKMAPSNIWLGDLTYFIGNSVTGNWLGHKALCACPDACSEDEKLSFQYECASEHCQGLE